MAIGSGRAAKQMLLCALLPLALMAAVSWPTFHAPAVLGLGAFLMTLWQVHASVSGIAIVVFVFLLQTANVSRRSTVSVLALAIESGILAASAYALATTCAIGLALGASSLYASTHLPDLAANGVHTYPVVAAIVLAALSNFAVVLAVLLRSLRFLSAKEIARLQKEAILQHVEAATALEVRRNASSIWLLQNSDGTHVETIYGPLAAGAPTWSLRGRGGRTLADVDVAALRRLSDARGGKQGEARVRLLAGIGSVPKRGDAVLEISGRPSWGERLELARALRWERVAADDAESLLQDASEEFMDAVRDGDVGRFREGMALCVAITERCLETLDGAGFRGADGTDTLSAVDAVAEMLRFGLDEALKTRRDDFALIAARGLSDAALAGFEHANRSVVRRYLALYPFLRKVVRSLGLGAEPIYDDLHWRSLQSLGSMLMPIMGREGDPEFVPIALGVVEEVLVTMMRDSIQEGSPDLDRLMEAWRLTFSHSEHPRARVFGRNDPVQRPPKHGGHWIALAGWAFYLAEADKLDTDALKRTVDALLGRFGSADGIVRAFVESASERADLADLENWILWSRPEGIVYGMDGRPPMTHAAIALLLRKGGTAAPAQGLEAAAPLHDVVRQAVAELQAEGGGARRALIGAGVSEEGLAERLEGFESAFAFAEKALDDRKRAELRAKPIDESLARSFEKDLANAYLGVSLIRALPSVFTVSPEPPSSPLGGTTHSLEPKDLFVEGASASRRASLAKAYGEEADVGETSSLLQSLAKAKGTTVERVPYGRLLERLASVCAERGGGLLVIRGGGARLGIYSHPRFRYGDGDGDAHAAVFGTLAGVPVAYGRQLEPYGAIYLPPASVRVRHGEKGASGRVESIDEERAEAIVREWEEGGTSYMEAERADKIERLQEFCGVSLFVPSEAVGNGIVAFVSDDMPEDEM